MHDAGVPAYLARFNIIPDNLCLNCGRAPGTLEHYFFNCQVFDEERYILEKGISDLGFNDFNLNILLIGNDNPKNLDIVKLLMTYIKQTGMHNTL